MSRSGNSGWWIDRSLIKIADQFIDQELIKPCTSEWCNPVVMFRKGDGLYHLRIDFRKVNEISKGDAYPIPFMREKFDKLSLGCYISTIDLNKAYHQIPLSEESKPKKLPKANGQSHNV